MSYFVADHAVFFFRQKTAYEMRISDWSSDVCSSDLPLAVSSPHRSRSLPDVPTMDEAGFKGFRAGSWFGLFAPKGTPPEIVAKLRDSVNRIIDRKSVV